MSTNLQAKDPPPFTDTASGLVRRLRLESVQFTRAASSTSHKAPRLPSDEFPVPPYIERLELPDDEGKKR